MVKKMVALLLVLVMAGTLTAYAQFQKEPDVTGCVSVFREVKPLSKTPKEISVVEVLVKAIASRDIRSLAKPWEIEYRGVKVVKHEVEYRGEKIDMVAIGIPLKNDKVLAYYEFSESVEGVRSLAYLLSVNGSRIKTEAVSINGHVTTLDSCPHECSKDSDCPYYPMEECVLTCCEGNVDMGCIVECCGYTCLPACMSGLKSCALCVFVICPVCITLEGCIECFEWGTTCEEASWD